MNFFVKLYFLCEDFLYKFQLIFQISWNFIDDEIFWLQDLKPPQMEVINNS